MKCGLFALIGVCLLLISLETRAQLPGPTGSVLAIEATLIPDPQDLFSDWCAIGVMYSGVYRPSMGVVGLWVVADFTRPDGSIRHAEMLHSFVPFTNADGEANPGYIRFTASVNICYLALNMQNVYCPSAVSVSLYLVGKLGVVSDGNMGIADLIFGPHHTVLLF